MAYVLTRKLSAKETRIRFVTYEDFTTMVNRPRAFHLTGIELTRKLSGLLWPPSGHQTFRAMETEITS